MPTETYSIGILCLVIVEIPWAQHAVVESVNPAMCSFFVLCMCVKCMCVWF